MMKNITDLEPEDIEARFRKMKSKANSLRNQFELMKIDNGNKPAAFAKKIFYDLQNFEPWIKIVRAFKTEGLEEKHIEKLNSSIDRANGSEDGSLKTLNIKMDIPIS